ncbi:MAG: MCE family protein [Nocardioides sp.]|uniref:MCE family protein n=1 Tax=Nocardioides sp. TaxID=35761 RepID=UPI0039E5FE91
MRPLGRTARTSRRATPAVLATVLLALLLSGCGFSVYSLPLPGGADTGSDPLSIKVQFADVLDLVPQSTVKVDDVTVGKVTSVELDDGVAVVTLSIRRDTDLPANTRAEIQQTSLLGEKYVDLVAPTGDETATGRLQDGATIPLSRTGRNPEIEEVLGALSLILNGGGVAQLKTITTEINKALGGREDSARAVLSEVDQLVTNLDDNRGQIVKAITSLNRLAKSARGQEKTIDATLDELPSALTSIDSQRKDLVTMLKALDKLGATGVRVIKASKDSTIATLRDLKPVLTKLADSGDSLVTSLDTFLTYPFVDAAVGTTPQAARSTHYGDYVNLDITLDLNLSALNNLPDVGETVCQTLKEVGSKLSLDQLLELNPDILCNSTTAKNLSKCQTALEKNLSSDPPVLSVPASCAALPTSLVGDLADEISDIVQDPTGAICDLVKLLCDGTGNTSSSTSSSGSGSDDSDSTLGNLTCSLPVSLCRAPAGYQGQWPPTKSVRLKDLGKVLDPSLVSLMMPGLDTTSGGTS